MNLNKEVLFIRCYESNNYYTYLILSFKGGTFLLAGRCERNNSPWKESVAGKKIIQGVRGDLKSRIAATGYLYGLLTTQDLNCAL